MDVAKVDLSDKFIVSFLDSAGASAGESESKYPDDSVPSVTRFPRNPDYHKDVTPLLI